MKPHEKPSRVLVLYNDTLELIKGEARDLLADRGVVGGAHGRSAGGLRAGRLRWAWQGRV
jgi:hypothetical protein